MYQEHFLNENFGYSVRLTNNHAITMSREIVEDFINSLRLSEDFRLRSSIKKEKPKTGKSR